MIREQSDALAKSFAASKDKVVLSALWGAGIRPNNGLANLTELRRRLRLVKRPGVNEPETLYLDGEPLLQFGPMEFHTEYHEDRVVVRLTQDVRDFR